MNELPPLTPRRSAPGVPTSEGLAAVKATARRRLARAGLVVGTGLATVAVVGAVSLASTERETQGVQVAVTPAPTGTTFSPHDLNEQLFVCLRGKGVTVTESANGFTLAYKPPHEGDPELDDLRYACSLELQARGIPVIVPSPVAGPDITQVLEIRFKPGTYSDDAQARVDACYRRDGVTPLPSTAPSPPSQRFRFVGNNVAEGHVIFDCLSVIPGVVVVDVPRP